MKDTDQFGIGKVSGDNASSGSFDCSNVQQWLADAAEETLSPDVAKQLNTHTEHCPACREQIEQSRCGRDWLLLLKQETPEPSVDLAAKILAKTSLATSSNIPVIAPQGSTATRAGTLPFSFFSYPNHPISKIDRLSEHNRLERNSVVFLRRSFLEPRLALVAAMAFFSISFTLNLMGVRLTNLTPTGLRRTITRQYADTNARVVRYYENLPIVYEIEARVQQLRRTETGTPTGPTAKPTKQSPDTGADSTASHSEPQMEAASQLPFEHPPFVEFAAFHSSNHFIPMQERKLA